MNNRETGWDLLCKAFAETENEKMIAKLFPCQKYLLKNQWQKIDEKRATVIYKAVCPLLNKNQIIETSYLEFKTFKNTIPKEINELLVKKICETCEFIGGEQ